MDQVLLNVSYDRGTAIYPKVNFPGWFSDVGFSCWLPIFGVSMFPNFDLQPMFSRSLARSLGCWN